MLEEEMKSVISSGSACAEDFMCTTVLQKDGTYKVEYWDMRRYREQVKKYTEELREATEILRERCLYCEFKVV